MMPGWFWIFPGAILVAIILMPFIGIWSNRR